VPIVIYYSSNWSMAIQVTFGTCDLTQMTIGRNSVYKFAAWRPNWCSYAQMCTEEQSRQNTRFRGEKSPTYRDNQLQAECLT